MLKDDPLRGLIEELTPAQQQELGDLEEVSRHLRAYRVPDPTPGEHAALVTSLKGALSRPGPERFGIQGWVRLFFAQARLFEVEFWYACGGIWLFTLVSGLFVGNAGLSLFTLLVSPLLAMAGVFYVFHHDSNSLSLLEAASPVGPLALFFCRSALVLGINLVTLPLLLVPGQVLFPQLEFWRVVVLWLGAVVGLFGLATYTTVRWNGLIGTVLPLALWGLLVGASGQQAIIGAEKWAVTPEWLLLTATGSTGLLWGALLAIALGAWLFFQAGRRVQRDPSAWA
jgi:hypothetical protein